MQFLSFSVGQSGVNANLVKENSQMVAPIPLKIDAESFKFRGAILSNIMKGAVRIVPDIFAKRNMKMP